MTTYEAITQLLGNVVLYSGVSVAIAFGFFRYLGKGYIDNWRAKDLEKYKMEQDSKINTQFNKVLKNQEKEYDILPMLWEKLQKLHIKIEGALFFLTKLPDLNRADEKYLENFIKDNEIPETVAENLRSGNDKNSVYKGYLDWKQMNDALKAFHDFKEYYQINKIFLSSKLKEKFFQIHKHLWSVWVDKTMSISAEGSQIDFLSKAYKEMEEKVKPLLNEIEELVQKHLYNYEL
jgi:hypothetical protein